MLSKRDMTPEQKRMLRRQKHFKVTFTAQGTYGDAMVILGNRPAYVQPANGLRPEMHQTWIVQVAYQNKKLIILHPIRQVIE